MSEDRSFVLPGKTVGFEDGSDDDDDYGRADRYDPFADDEPPAYRGTEPPGNRAAPAKRGRPDSGQRISKPTLSETQAHAAVGAIPKELMGKTRTVTYSRAGEPGPGPGPSADKRRKLSDDNYYSNSASASESDDDIEPAPRRSAFPSSIRTERLIAESARVLAPSTSDFSSKNPRDPRTFNPNWIEHGPPEPGQRGYKLYKQFRANAEHDDGRKWHNLIAAYFDDTYIRNKIVRETPLWNMLDKFAGYCAATTVEMILENTAIQTASSAMRDKIKDIIAAQEAETRQIKDLMVALQTAVRDIDSDFAVLKDLTVSFWMGSSATHPLFVSANGGILFEKKVLTSFFNIFSNSHHFVAYALWVNGVIAPQGVLGVDKMVVDQQGSDVVPLADFYSADEKEENLKRFVKKLTSLRKEVDDAYKENGVDILDYVRSTVRGPKSTTIPPAVFNNVTRPIAKEIARSKANAEPREYQYYGSADQILYRVWNSIFSIHADDWRQHLPALAELTSAIGDLEKNGTVDAYVARFNSAAMPMQMNAVIKAAFLGLDSVAKLPEFKAEHLNTVASIFERYGEFLSGGPRDDRLDEASEDEEAVVLVETDNRRRVAADDDDEDEDNADSLFDEREEMQIVEPNNARLPLKRRLKRACANLGTAFSVAVNQSTAISEIARACYTFARQIFIDDNVDSTHYFITTWDDRFEDCFDGYTFAGILFARSTPRKSPVSPFSSESAASSFKDFLSAMALAYNEAVNLDAPLQLAGEQREFWLLLKKMEIYINRLFSVLQNRRDGPAIVAEQTLSNYVALCRAWVNQGLVTESFKAALTVLEKLLALFFDFVEHGFDAPFQSLKMYGNNFKFEFELRADGSESLFAPRPDGDSAAAQDERFPVNPTQRLRVVPVFGVNLISKDVVDIVITDAQLKVTGFTREQLISLYYVSEFYRVSQWIAETRAHMYVSLRLAPMAIMFQAEMVRMTLGAISTVWRSIMFREKQALAAKIKVLRNRSNPIASIENMIKQEEERNIIVTEARRMIEPIYTGFVFTKPFVRTAFESAQEAIRTDCAVMDPRWRFFDMKGLFSTWENANSDFATLFARLAALMRSRTNSTAGISVVNDVLVTHHQVELMGIYEKVALYEPLNSAEEYAFHVPELRGRKGLAY